MLIRDLMTPGPVTVRPEASVEDVAKLLLAYHINGVPVVDQTTACPASSPSRISSIALQTNRWNPENLSGRRTSGFPSSTATATVPVRPKAVPRPMSDTRREQRRPG